MRAANYGGHNFTTLRRILFNLLFRGCRRAHRVAIHRPTWDPIMSTLASHVVRVIKGVGFVVWRLEEYEPTQPRREDLPALGLDYDKPTE